MAQRVFQNFLGVAQSLPGFSNHKPYAQIHSTEQGTPLCNPAPYGTGSPPNYHLDPKMSPKHEVLTSRFHTIRRYIKIAVICSNIFSGILSLIMEIGMIFVTWKFYKTKDHPTPGRAWGPWPKETRLWPTYMLAAASGLTALLSLCLLIAQCCRAKRKAAFFSVLYSLVHIGFWIGISATYRIAKKKDDLWGWSCSEQAKEIQKQLGSKVLNFESLCNIQVSFLCHIIVLISWNLFELYVADAFMIGRFMGGLNWRSRCQGPDVWCILVLQAQGDWH